MRFWRDGKTHRRQTNLLVIGLILVLAVGTGFSHADPGDPDDTERQRRLMERYEKMIQFNLATDRALPADEINARMGQFQALSLGERVASWAEYFWQRGDVQYLNGTAPGGYAKAGRLVDDFSTDCVLFFYRTTELGRSTTALEAVQFAFGTRFYGAALEMVVDDAGRLDYASPVHLDYSVDIIRSGLWGEEITAKLGELQTHDVGTSRYERGSVHYVLDENVNLAALQSGDILFFVSNEETDVGRAIREAGAIIGHIGIVKVEEGVPHLIHPAARPIEGLYAGGRIEKLPLKTYLERVESFKGVMATRLKPL